MNYRDRIELFEDEIELISNESVRSFIKVCLKQSPDYVFEDCPSSSSGKYHPLDELGPDGTILHTRKVFALAYELSRGLDCEEHRDEICAAALLHDMAKQGLTQSGHTVRDHPQIMAKFVADTYTEKFTDKLSRDSAVLIYNGVFYHYGPWTEKSVRKPLSKYTNEELSVYLADYISSKRFVEIKCKKRLNIGV